MFFTVLFWFIWLVGLIVTLFAAYVVVNPETRKSALAAYRIAALFSQPAQLTRHSPMPTENAVVEIAILTREMTNKWVNVTPHVRKGLAHVSELAEHYADWNPDQGALEIYFCKRGDADNVYVTRHALARAEKIYPALIRDRFPILFGVADDDSE